MRAAAALLIEALTVIARDNVTQALTLADTHETQQTVTCTSRSFQHASRF